jgi:hypothetical protein
MRAQRQVGGRNKSCEGCFGVEIRVHLEANLEYRWGLTGPDEGSEDSVWVQEGSATVFGYGCGTGATAFE